MIAEPAGACYGCHKQSGKALLRVGIPKQAGGVINADPAAKWPQ